MADYRGWSMASRDDINTPMVAVVGFLGAIIVFAVIVLLIVVYYNAEGRQRAEKELAVPPAEIRRLVAQQEGQLADYRLLDSEKKIVAIPISRAMKLVVDELADSSAKAAEARSK